MAILLNESDQFGLSFEIPRGTKANEDWLPLRLALISYLEGQNEFWTIVEAYPDIYKADAARLSKLFRAFGAAVDSSKNFDFKPQVEPSFELSFHRVPHGDDFCRVASIAIGFKSLLSLRIPCGYGENRIIMRLHTNEMGMQRFISEVLAQLAKASNAPAVLD